MNRVSRGLAFALTQLPNGDRVKKYDDEELVVLVTKFVKSRIDRVSQEEFPEPEKLTGANGQLYLDRLATQILMQLVYSIQEDLFVEKLELAKMENNHEHEPVLAPETPEMLDKKPHPSTIRFIPETLAVDQDFGEASDNDGDGSTPSMLESQRHVTKTEQTPVLKLPTVPETQLEEQKQMKSPSLLSKRPITPENDDLDDFREDSFSKPIKVIGTTKKRRRQVQEENRFGLTKRKPLSQSEKSKMMKQTDISLFMRGERPKSDLERAKELSLLSAQGENLDDSFNQLPEKEPLIKDLGYKYQHGAVRKKQDRQNELIGFECPDCIGWWEGKNLTEEERRQKIEQCSKHRAKFVPEPYSPQAMWNLEESTNPELEKTQVGSPIRVNPHRAKRRQKLQQQMNEKFKI